MVAASGNPIPFLRKGSRDELRAATGDDKLPALKLPDGTVLTPSRAILAWVAEQEQPAVLHRRLLESERAVHVRRHVLPGEDLEVGPAAGGEPLDRLDETDRALLEEVALAEPAICSLLGGTQDPVEVGRGQ